MKKITKIIIFLIIKNLVYMSLYADLNIKQSRALQGEIKIMSRYITQVKNTATKILDPKDPNAAAVNTQVFINYTIKSVYDKIGKSAAKLNTLNETSAIIVAVLQHQINTLLKIFKIQYNGPFNTKGTLDSDSTIRSLKDLDTFIKISDPKELMTFMFGSIIKFPQVTGSSSELMQIFKTAEEQVIQNYFTNIIILFNNSGLGNSILKMWNFSDTLLKMPLGQFASQVSQYKCPNSRICNSITKVIPPIFHIIKSTMINQFYQKISTIVEACPLPIEAWVNEAQKEEKILIEKAMSSQLLELLIQSKEIHLNKEQKEFLINTYKKEGVYNSLSPAAKKYLKYK